MTAENAVGSFCLDSTKYFQLYNRVRNRWSRAQNLEEQVLTHKIKHEQIRENQIEGIAADELKWAKMTVIHLNEDCSGQLPRTWNNVQRTKPETLTGQKIRKRPEFKQSKQETTILKITEFKNIYLKWWCDGLAILHIFMFIISRL